MPKHLIFSLVVIFLSACFFVFGKQKTDEPKEFEGVITYHEVGKGIDSIFNVDDTLRLYYSKGNYVGIHSEKSSRFHLVKDYYLKNESLRLYQFNNSDTLHQLKLFNPIEKLESFKVAKINERVFSKNCEQIDIITNYAEGDSKTYSDFSIVFSRGFLPINKEHFKNWHLGYFNKVLAEAGSYYLRLKAVHFDKTHNVQLSSKEYDIISVKEQPINQNLFKIDSTKIRRD